MIPTYKRHPYLIRLIKFLNSYENPIKILILDSTPETLYDEKIHEIINNDRITHIRFDADVTFWDKIAIGAQKINTDFVTLCADDDFIIPNAAVSCMEFLKENKNYSSAHGLFYQHPNYDRAKKTGFSLAPLYQERIDSFGDTASERLSGYLSGKGLNPLYAVHRSSAFSLIWSETSKYVSDWNLHEIFPCCLSSIYGKTKRLSIFYASRETNNYPVNNYDIIKKTLSQKKVNRVIEGIVKHLVKLDGLPIEETRLITRRAFQKYIDGTLKKFPIKSTHQLINPSTIYNNLKKTIRWRNRLQLILYKGCHPSIYNNHIKDYDNIKKSVILGKIGFEDLNRGRKEYISI